MRLLVLTSDIPYPYHNVEGVTAVNIIAHALLREWGEMGHVVILQIIFNQFRAQTTLSESERQALDALRQQGVEVLEPIFYGEYKRRYPTGWFGRIQNRLLPRPEIEEFYPSVRLASRIKDYIRDYEATAAISIYCPEGVAALYGVRGIPRIVYHGDIDFVPTQVRIEDHAFFTGQALSPTQLANSRARLARYERAHLRLMTDMDAIGNHAANNVAYYQEQGHPRSFYLPNTWVDVGKERAQCIIDAAYARLASGHRPVKIIGHFGYLNRTGSNYGLRFLAGLLPVLERAMQGIDYRVHIIGGGEMLPSLKAQFSHPAVVLSGYAEDLDRELDDSDLFLFLNNAGPLRAAYTRHVVAWATGMCLAVHRGSQEAIPEIADRENALVGDNPEQLATSIREIVTDPDLNRRVRTGGRAMYEQRFAPRHIAAQLAEVAAEFPEKSVR
jgi:glycosyltransferase involved in cell wall biosynthesis